MTFEQGLMVGFSFLLLPASLYLLEVVPRKLARWLKRKPSTPIDVRPPGNVILTKTATSDADYLIGKGNEAARDVERAKREAEAHQAQMRMAAAVERVLGDAAQAAPQMMGPVVSGSTSGSRGTRRKGGPRAPKLKVGKLVLCGNPLCEFCRGREGLGKSVIVVAERKGYPLGFLIEDAIDALSNKKPGLASELRRVLTALEKAGDIHDAGGHETEPGAGVSHE